MKGVIFNLLEGVVTEELGEDAWDEVLAERYPQPECVFDVKVSK